MIKQSTFSDTQHIPNAFQICLVLVLHCFQSLIYIYYSLLYCLYFKLYKGRYASLQRGIIDLLIHCHFFPLLTHQPMHLCKGYIFSKLMQFIVLTRLNDTSLNLFEYTVVIFYNLFELIFQLLVNKFTQQPFNLFNKKS